MSSVAVLTPESFAEHRSGIKDQEMTGIILVWDQWIDSPYWSCLQPNASSFQGYIILQPSFLFRLKQNVGTQAFRLRLLR